MEAGSQTYAYGDTTITARAVLVLGNEGQQNVESGTRDN
jgi:hypothetical protein